jgi:hypothetical protein
LYVGELRESPGSGDAQSPDLPAGSASISRRRSRPDGPTTTELEDRLEILDLIGHLALTIDARDWDTLGQRRGVVTRSGSARPL